ncbi:hypothetical protein CU098_012975 [Rhizopus stolonifer]|uniref:PH domain-containing protein n=2 Tax=Mucorineae TaxID=1344963 RepID=A0A367KTD3_RHIST|nr:hypothetical protein CU098_012975 [Rhizopus stolonifer]
MTVSSDIPNNDYYRTDSSDIELATEIGQGLLSEIRRMQIILQKRQESLIQLEKERTDNQQHIADLIKELRLKNDTEERLKEEIYNLELTKQSLSHQIQQLSLTVSQAQMEETRREKQEGLIHQKLESFKESQIKWQEAQAEYESKLALLNESIAKLRNENQSARSRLENSEVSDKEEGDLKADFQNDMHIEQSQDMQDDSNPTEPINNIVPPHTALEKASLNEDHNKALDSMQHLWSESALVRFEAHHKEIMHTMAGERLYKFSTSYVKWSSSSKRHLRFFWIHPYTRTLYWSEHEPGLQHDIYKAKSVQIETFSIDPLNQENSIPIIIINSSTKSIKIQCTNEDSHEQWTKSLRRLVVEVKSVIPDNLKRKSLSLFLRAESKK